ncbi:hypothetical protein SB724_20345, partial [Bacillus sp. SIMBA_031]
PRSSHTLLPENARSSRSGPTELIGEVSTQQHASGEENSAQNKQDRQHREQLPAHSYRVPQHSNN